MASEIQNDMNAPVTTAAGIAQRHRTPLVAQLREALLGNLRTARGGDAPPTAQTTAAKHRHSQQSAAFSPGTSATSTDAPSPQHLIEIGDVLVTQQWQRVDFNSTFVEPILIANTLSAQSTTPTAIRIRNVRPTGFEIRLQPWDDVEGSPSSETVGFLALERGTYTLVDGTMVEAGHVTADPSRLSQGIRFGRPFNTVPVVMTAVTSANEAGSTASQLQTVTKNGLRFRLHRMLKSPQVLTPETLSYIAWEPSSGSLQGYAFEVNRVPNVEQAPGYTLMFAAPFEDSPIFLAEIQGTQNNALSILRWADKHTRSVDVKIDVGLRPDAEALSRAGTIGYIVVW